MDKHDDDDDFLFYFLACEENKMLCDSDKKEEEKQENKTSYNSDYSYNSSDLDSDKNYDSTKKHNIFLDLFLVYITGGIWLIWMIIRWFKERGFNVKYVVITVVSLFILFIVITSVIMQ